jgi:hypothetical protein
VASDSRELEIREVNANLLRGLASLTGIELDDERAIALVAQAVPHFNMLRHLDAIAVPTTEPAAEFRLDGWTRSSDA